MLKSLFPSRQQFTQPWKKKNSQLVLALRNGIHHFAESSSIIVVHALSMALVT
jgi:hypothetical protein